MQTQTRRFTWRCPECGQRYSVRGGCEPKLCPKCREPDFVEIPTPAPRRRRPSVLGWSICGVLCVVAVVVVTAVSVLNAPIQEAALNRPDRPDAGERHRIAVDAPVKEGDDGLLIQAVMEVAEDQIQAGSDLRAVRAWLRENTNSGDWEEVRWWPAIDLVDEHEDAIAASRTRIDELTRQKADAQNRIAQLTAAGIPRAPILTSGQSRPLPNLDGTYPGGLVEESWEYQRLEQQISDAKWIPEIEQQIRDLEASGPRRVCRIRYRTENSVGATMLYDDLFLLEDGRAVYVSSDYDSVDWHLGNFGRQLFENGETRLPIGDGAATLDALANPG